MRQALSLALLIVSATAFALPPQNVERSRHFILEPQHPLQADEAADLRAKGLTILRPLGANHFLVRVDEGADLAGDLRIRSLEPYGWTHKIAPSAYAEAAKGRAFARLRVVFHDDIALDDARAAIEAAGGSVDSPLAVRWELPSTIAARIPPAAMRQLASDERVFGVYGPPLRVRPTNVVAAQLSHVTPLFSAPYNLSGNGVVLSEFELATANTTHLQFQGRMTAHFNDTSNAEFVLHATHVGGTMISAGITDPRDVNAPNSKGMAPQATLHEFNATDDFATVVSNKDTQLEPLGVVADNNSWDFTLGWSFESPSWVWNGNFFGAYDPTYSSPYDAVAVKSGRPLFVHAAGNDASQGDPPLSAPFSPHEHCCDQNGNTIKTETFCYSPSGSGTDCGAPCSPGKSNITGEQHCETTKHPTIGPYGTIGLEASLKNVISIGAMDQFSQIAGFSSRGPTLDGRLKPEVVAKGVNQYSTAPGGYRTLQGTSMSSPVVTGISGLLVEQWRKTFSGQTPGGAILKTLLIAGADDQVGPSLLDPPGPDFSYGFGLVDAKNSVDLIIADGGTGSRIRTGTLKSGDTFQFPLSVASPQNVRVVLGWFDPEIVPQPDAPDTPTLLNDLDVKIIDPTGATVLPYVLDKNNPGATATRGVNHVDTTEMVEIKNAAAGQYKVVVTGTLGDPANHPTQDFVVVSNASLTATPPCGDIFEPNDTPATAFKYLSSGQIISARICSAADLDFYEIAVMKAGPLAVTVTATDTPLRVTLTGNGITPIAVDVPAQSTRTLSTNSTVGIYDVEVQPNGALGTSAAYTLSTTFSLPATTHHRAARH